MTQNYLVMKNSDPMELQNKYYSECIEQKQVQIVITTMRKYAMLNYDFDTLNNADQHIKGLGKCSIAEKISAYASQYASEHKLPTSRMPRLISDMVGGFEFFIEDIEKVGTAVSKIIDSVVKSDCIHFETKQEMIAKLSPQELEDLKQALGEEYFT